MAVRVEERVLVLASTLYIDLILTSSTSQPDYEFTRYQTLAQRQ